MVESKGQYLIKREEDVMYIKYDLTLWSIAHAYDNKTGKKKYFLWDKSTTPAKLRHTYPHIISFHPLIMNLMYLWPSHRREFLDNIIVSAFPNYQKTLLKYKKILNNRNKVLKNIYLEKSQISELDFWNEIFIKTASEIYTYRKKIVDFMQESQMQLCEYFFWKVSQAQFTYISKINISDVKVELRTYIRNNTKKEVLLRKTLRWPHLDDFDILIDNTPLIHFASRWEVKSVLLGLKFLETKFIQEHSDKKETIYLIDDLLSELDVIHRELLWKHVWNNQCIMTSIEDINIEWNKIYI